MLNCLPETTNSATGYGEGGRSAWAERREGWEVGKRLAVDDLRGVISLVNAHPGVRVGREGSSRS